MPLQLAAPTGIVPVALVMGLGTDLPAQAAFITIRHTRVDADDVSIKPADDAVLAEDVFGVNNDVKLFTRREGDRFLGIIQERRGGRTLPVGSQICKFRATAVEAMLRLVGENGVRTAVLDYKATFADRRPSSFSGDLQGTDAKAVIQLLAKSNREQHFGQIATLLQGFKRYTQAIIGGQVKNPLQEVVIALDEVANAVCQQNMRSLRSYLQIDQR